MMRHSSKTPLHELKNCLVWAAALATATFGITGCDNKKSAPPSVPPAPTLSASSLEDKETIAIAVKKATPGIEKHQSAGRRFLDRAAWSGTHVKVMPDVSASYLDGTPSDSLHVLDKNTTLEEGEHDIWDRYNIESVYDVIPTLRETFHNELFVPLFTLVSFSYVDQNKQAQYCYFLVNNFEEEQKVVWRRTYSFQDKKFISDEIVEYLNNRDHSSIFDQIHRADYRTKAQEEKGTRAEYIIDLKDVGSGEKSIGRAIEELETDSIKFTVVTDPLSLFDEKRDKNLSFYVTLDRFKKDEGKVLVIRAPIQSLTFFGSYTKKNEGMDKYGNHFRQDGAYGAVSPPLHGTLGKATTLFQTEHTEFSKLNGAIIYTPLALLTQLHGVPIVDGREHHPNALSASHIRFLSDDILLAQRWEHWLGCKKGALVRAITLVDSEERNAKVAGDQVDIKVSGKMLDYRASQQKPVPLVSHEEYHVLDALSDYDISSNGPLGNLYQATNVLKVRNFSESSMFKNKRGGGHPWDNSSEMLASLLNGINLDNEPDKTHVKWQQRVAELKPQDQKLYLDLVSGLLGTFRERSSKGLMPSDAPIFKMLEVRLKAFGRH